MAESIVVPPGLSPAQRWTEAQAQAIYEDLKGVIARVPLDGYGRLFVRAGIPCALVPWSDARDMNELPRYIDVLVWWTALSASARVDDSLESFHRASSIAGHVSQAVAGWVAATEDASEGPWRRGSMGKDPMASHTEGSGDSAMASGSARCAEARRQQAGYEPCSYSCCETGSGAHVSRE